MSVERLVPFRRLGPARPASPLVVAVPHAGRTYPPALLADSAVPQRVLEQLEDRRADALVGRLVEAGAVAVVATVARAWIDLNRGPEDAEPVNRSGNERPSARARSGLGLIPSRLNGRPLLHRPPLPATVAERLEQVHGPYHRAIADALAAAAAVHGRALLLDCHSMPSLGGAAPPGIVVGDLGGRSATPAVVQAALDAARAAGIRAALNQPYAGAYTLQRHGRPPQVDAIQLEVDRALYLDPSWTTTTAGADRIAALLASVGRAALAAQGPRPAVAAE